MDRRMTITVRPLTTADAEAIVGMHDAFMAYLGELGDPDSGLKHFTVERYLADGFGPDPVFAGYIAENGGAPCGYLLYCKGYNVDLAYRLFFVCDLWVQNGMYTGPTKWRSSSIASLAGWRATHWPS
jgi:hypothetical protein